MKTSTAWIVYSLLRLLFFAAPFAVLYVMGWPWYFAAIIATLVAVSLSVILLSQPRERAAQSIQEWRDQERTADDIVEDEALDTIKSSVFEGTAGETSSVESAVTKTAAAEAGKAEPAAAESGKPEPAAAESIAIETVVPGSEQNA